MKSSIRIIGVVSAFVGAFTLSGCNDAVMGRMGIQKSFSLKWYKTETEVLLPAGSHLSLVRLKENGTALELKLDKSAAAPKGVKIKFEIPKDAVNSRGGPISIKGETIGQKVDISGITQRTITETESQSEYRSCSETFQETVCEMIETKLPNGKITRHRECRDRDVTIYGNELVTYHHETDTLSIFASFIDPLTQEVLGTFNGDQSDTDEVIDLRGGCMLSRPRPGSRF